MIEDRYKRLTSALEQYNEGAITYVEFVNLTQCLMTDEDIAEYMQFVTPGEN